ncbi:hypothetical protein K438DRAFT_1772645 [Mycena galopus ATCC 62051]|nr:hypothetical protein K438DRAFT_1772645 [Mycena galopus ATCC 62051]
MLGESPACDSTDFDADTGGRFFLYIEDSEANIFLEEVSRQLLLDQYDYHVIALFRKVAEQLYKHWDPVCANIMVSADFDFNCRLIAASGGSGGTWRHLAAKSPGPTQLVKILSYEDWDRPGVLGCQFTQAHPPRYWCISRSCLTLTPICASQMTSSFLSKATLKPVGKVLVEMVREVGELSATLSVLFHNAYRLTLGRYKLSELGFGSS